MISPSRVRGVALVVGFGDHRPLPSLSVRFSVRVMSISEYMRVFASMEGKSHVY